MTKWKIFLSTIALMFLTCFAHAAIHVIEFELEEPGNVSLNVYNANGAVVRELLHAVPKAAGRHQIVWDGLDGDGKGVPAGNYSWKLLQTPGLQTTYLMSLGTNFPPGNTWRTASGPGTHGAPAAVAADDTGIYVSAGTTENIETCMLKMTPDGQTRLWSTLHPIPWDGARALAVDNGEVFMLGHRNPQSIYVYDHENGKMLRKIDVRWEAESNAIEATDMDMHEGVLIVAYQKQNSLRSYDPKTSQLLDAIELETPQGVALGSNGVIYATSGEQLVRLTLAAEPISLTTDLDRPGRMAVDHTTGDILVYVGGTQQILRYAADGTLKTTYGELGGRKPGIYNDITKRSFAGFSNIAADGAGRFYVTESGAAPRRTAHFAADGSVIREWYGGQRWAPHGEPEPGNPNVVWVGSQYGWVMRVLVDYEALTWEVHSTYQYSGLANGLVGDSWNEGGYFRIFERGGAKYFVLQKIPTILRIDEENWQLVPVTICANVDRSTDFVKEWAGANRSFQWNDTNGDGIPQEDEFTFYPNGLGARFQPVVAEDFTCYFVGFSEDGFNVRKAPVVEWNDVGAPFYGDLPDGEHFADVPSRFARNVHQDTRWAVSLHKDSATGDLIAALNPWTSGWCDSPDSFMQRWNADGSPKWTVGRQGGYRTSIPGEIHRNLRAIAGIAHDCVVVIDVDGGWDMRNLAMSYIWDANGLFVGGVMDNPNLDGIADYWYQCSGEFCHSSVATLPDGDVLFYGNWENEMRVYRITGWDGWQRQEGRVLVTRVSEDNLGQGLTAEYFETTDMTAPVTVRVDDTINFRWGTGSPAGTGITRPDTYSVRWRGIIVPEYGPTYHGPWSFRRDNNAYDGGLRGARDDHAAVEFRFRGESVSVIGNTTPNSGFVNIYLNGERVKENFDCYSEAVQRNVVFFEAADLEPGDHVLKLVVAGWRSRRNPKSSDSWVMLDKFVVDGKEIDANGMVHTFTARTDNHVQLWVNRNLSFDSPTRPEGEETAVANVKMLLRPQDIQLNLLKTTGRGDVRLTWSCPFTQERLIPTEGLFPVATGAPREVKK